MNSVVVPIQDKTDQAIGTRADEPGESVACADRECDEARDFSDGLLFQTLVKSSRIPSPYHAVSCVCIQSRRASSIRVCHPRPAALK